jgi:hypothetical protein
MLVFCINIVRVFFVIVTDWCPMPMRHYIIVNLILNKVTSLRAQLNQNR